MPTSTRPSLDRPLTLGICLGDVTGIGPEITAKALQAELAADDTRYVIVGDPAALQAAIEGTRLEGQFVEYSRATRHDRLIVHSADRPPLPSSLSPAAPEAAEAALAWLTTAARLALSGTLDGMITAPLSKEAVLRTGRQFVGQTEYLTELAGGPRTAMMLLGHDERHRWLRVVLVTTHLPLRDLAQAITPERIETAVRLAVVAGQDLGLPQVRIAVCGLNPHAGEGGLLGDEELRIITPTLNRLRSEGVSVDGPLSGDTVFHAAVSGRYEVVVAMYHDQGLAPLKLLAFDTGVNWTLGLPFVRTSPDHGPAYDIAGHGIAVASSMRSAIQLARQLAHRRVNHAPLA